MACSILLAISSVFCKNIVFGILAIIFARFGFFEVFRAYFYMFWDISLKLGIYMQLVVLHVKFEFHSNRDILTYFTAKNRSKSFICINGLKNHIEASDLIHTLILWVSWSLLIFVLVGNFWPSGGQKHLKGGVTRGPGQRKISGLILHMLWDISLKIGIYIQWVVSHVKFEFHSNLDTLTYFTAKNKSKSFICIHGLKNYIQASDLVHTQIVSLPLLIFVMLGHFLALWWTKTLERGS